MLRKRKYSEAMEPATTSPQKPRGILELPNEILLDILRAVDTDLRPIDVDQRAYMSVISFKYESSLPRDPKVVSDFRLTCKRFSDIGIQHQFKAIRATMSEPDLQRLRNIASQPHLAQAVQKFSYLVPKLYFRDESQIDTIEREICLHGDKVPAQFLIKARSQVAVTKSSLDQEILSTAFAAFQSLQHVALLRLHMEIDERLISYMNRHGFTDDMQPSKTESYIHGLQTLCEALRVSKSPASRISFPFMDAHTASYLQDIPAAGLECLLLRFIDANEFRENFSRISPGLDTVLMSANRLATLHIGFHGSSRPATVPLAKVFRDEKLSDLRVVSLESWQLDSEEIINLVRNHRKTLKGVRLRRVLLKRGSRWTDVLRFLRKEVKKLTWVSLSEADYVEGFENRMPSGMDITDINPTWSDLENDFNAADTDYEESTDTESSLVNSGHTTDIDDGHDGGDERSEGGESEADAEIGALAHYPPDLGRIHDDGVGIGHNWEESSAVGDEQPTDGNDGEGDAEADAGHASGDDDPFPQPPPHFEVIKPTSNCTCPSIEELNDEYDGQGIQPVVTRRQRAAWEAWVLRVCPRHGSSSIKGESPDLGY